MNRWREWIDLYEEKLKELSKAQKLMLLLLIIAMIGGSGYYFFIQEKIAHLHTLQARLSKLDKTIHKNSPRYLEAKIARLKKEIANIRTILDRQQAKKMELLAKLEKKKAMLLNAFNFSKLLEDILRTSYLYGVVLDKVVILDKNTPFLGKIEQQKEVTIQGQSDFLPLVRFLRSIEDHPMLLQIANLHVETNGSTPTFAFDMRLYGGRW